MIGYHASHEQFSPAQLLEYAALAQKAGFGAIMSSDHTAPWSVQQGESGFVWSWLGAAMQNTAIPFGSLAVPIGFRYHPLLVAQAAATLDDMFPARLPWIAVGSGEALNESMTGQIWPDKPERNDRLREGVDMIRRLWDGQTVTQKDTLIAAENARLWTLPKHKPKILGAALTPDTARWMGAWADGLITVRMPPDDMQRMIRAFHAGGGKGKPLVLQMQIAWAPTRDAALQMAFEQWKCITLSNRQKAGLRTTQAMDAATQNVKPADIEKNLLISADAQDFIDWINAYRDMGFEEIYLHNACPNQQDFIAFFSAHVLPRIKTRAPGDGMIPPPDALY